MTKRLFAIAFIFACTSLAWVLLGATIFERTGSADDQLRGQVGSTWGSSHAQGAPTAFSSRTETHIREQPGAAPRTETIEVRDLLALDQTRADVAITLDHRQKGLLWYSTYAVRFQGGFRFRNTTRTDSVRFEFPLPAEKAIYDDLTVTLNGAPVTYALSGPAIVLDAVVPAGSTAALAVSYRSQGLDEWRYVLGKDVAAVRDFDLVMHTDFDAIDFPANALSPTDMRDANGGWQLQWRYTNLLSGFQIGMAMPQKLQPGPLAGQIALFAPVSLLFFFAVMFMITTIRGIDLHPMNYAFIAAGFFSFHVLLAYMVDHISIHVGFIIASVVSVFLVVSYLRLAVGPRFAFREAAAAQFIFLVLFSYAFFFKGFTGLAITIGSVMTLFLAMQLTGRISWSRVFAGERIASPAADGMA